MLGLLPFQGVVYLLNQYHRALPWAKSKPCPFGAQADKQVVELTLFIYGENISYFGFSKHNPFDLAYSNQKEREILSSV